MTINIQNEIRELRARGILFHSGAPFQGYVDRAISGDFNLAMDAQPTLVTVSNAGIPAYLVNYLDPQFIRVLVSPMKAAEIVGERKVGDWTMATSQFPVVESAGETTAYGDYNNSGNTSSNYNWVSRQAFTFQTITQTVHGVTKSVVLDAKLNKSGEHPMKKSQAIGFDATGTLKRSDFGVAAYVPNVSDEIKIHITTEGVVAKTDAAK